MIAKIINATELKIGTNIFIEKEPYAVRKVDISKTGKHGHAKVRLEAVGIFTGSKKVMVSPGHDRFEVPLVNKRKGQVLSLGNKTASVMDLETFENFDIQISEEIEKEIEENSKVEYWEINDQRIIKRKI